MMAVMERNSWDDGGIALVLGFGAVNMLMCMLINDKSVLSVNQLRAARSNPNDSHYGGSCTKSKYTD